MKASLILRCFACSTTYATASSSEVRQVGTFTGLSIETAAEVEVTIGPVSRVEVSAPSDWLPKLETRVERGVLHLATPGAHRHMPTFKVTITTPSLDAIAIAGAGEVHASKLHAKRLAIEVTGAGELDLAGSTEELTLAIAGEAELHTKDLVADTATIQVSGACDATLHVTRSLSAAIAGTASVVVYGKPAITRSISGVGTIELR
jgi:hypothetical protein